MAGGTSGVGVGSEIRAVLIVAAVVAVSVFAGTLVFSEPPPQTARTFNPMLPRPWITYSQDVRSLLVRGKTGEALELTRTVLASRQSFGATRVEATHFLALLLDGTWGPITPTEKQAEQQAAATGNDAESSDAADEWGGDSSDAEDADESSEPNEAAPGQEAAPSGGDRPRRFLRRLAMTNDPAEAWRGLERMADRASSSAGLDAVYFRAWAALGQGREEEARELFLQAAEPLAGAGSSSLSHYNRACMLAMAGETDAAIEALERSVELGYVDTYWARVDHDLMSLHGNERFERLFTLSPIERKAAGMEPEGVVGSEPEGPEVPRELEVSPAAGDG